MIGVGMYRKPEPETVDALFKLMTDFSGTQDTYRILYKQVPATLVTMMRGDMVQTIMANPSMSIKTVAIRTAMDAMAAAPGSLRGRCLRVSSQRGSSMARRHAENAAAATPGRHPVWMSQQQDRPV